MCFNFSGTVSVADTQKPSNMHEVPNALLGQINAWQFTSADLSLVRLDTNDTNDNTSNTCCTKGSE